MLSPTQPESETTPEQDGELLAAGVQVGEYAIEALLGAGGFARVYRARHVTLGTRVAIKVLSRALALDPQAMVRFVREAQAATRITHPNVVRVLGFGRHEDGRAYQVMDLVDGITLEQHLETRDRLPLDEALALLEGIGAGLEAAHAAGIVHRDLKPSNVMLARAGDRRVPRLADFGIAKAIEGDEDPRLTQTGVTLGTPMYMSPEQALGRAITNASDVYTFGVVAFELLTGRVPFTAETPFETMMMHVQTEAPVASSVAPGLASSFDAPLARMLAKAPPARPTLAEALRELRTAATTSPRPWPRRWIGIGVAVVVAIALIAAVGWRSTSSEPPPHVAPALGPAVEPSRRAPTPAATPTPPPPPATTSAPELDRPIRPPKGQPPVHAPRQGSAQQEPKPSTDSFETPPGYP